MQSTTENTRADRKLTVLMDAELQRELQAEQRRLQQQAGLRVSLSATAASLMRRALEQPRS